MAGRVRSYLRKLWRTGGRVDGSTDPSKSEAAARDFGDEPAQAYNEAQCERNAIDRDWLKWAVPTLRAGLAVRGIFTNLCRCSAFRQKVPMSVFIDWDRT